MSVLCKVKSSLYPSSITGKFHITFRWNIIEKQDNIDLFIIKEPQMLKVSLKFPLYLGIKHLINNFTFNLPFKTMIITGYHFNLVDHLLIFI